jgi:hypothetical protein
MPAVNWKQAERKMLPEGDYDAVFTEGKVEPAKDGKSMNFVAKFIITEKGDFEGRSTMRYYNLTEKSLWATRDFFLEMGIDESDFEDTESDEEFYESVRSMIEEVAGDACVITIQHNPDTNGKVDRDGNPLVYANVQKVTAAA